MTGGWLLVLLAVGLSGCMASGSPSVSPSHSATSATPGESAITVYAAGDIASCESEGDEATAELLDGLLAAQNGEVLVLGDLAYEEGTAAQFADCYDPSWGRFLSRTWPTPGNHEYEARDADPYFAYFADRPTGAPDGWYDARLTDAWWLISLNSNCDQVGGCDARSSQGRYLAALLDRLALADVCVLAFWHHPRWSSGDEHGSDVRTDALWRLLADSGADLVLTGHDHTYERFEPMGADGATDPAGLTQFVVGTGGRSLYGFGEILPTSAVHDSSTYGVLQLTLRPGGYDWAFVPVAGGTFTDSGSASCR